MLSAQNLLELVPRNASTISTDVPAARKEKTSDSFAPWLERAGANKKEFLHMEKQSFSKKGIKPESQRLEILETEAENKEPVSLEKSKTEEGLENKEVSTNEISDTKPPEEEAPVEEVDERAIMAMMQSQLKVPVEVIYETLETLEIEISDLMEMEPLQDFLMEIHQVDRLGELLDIPTIVEEVEEISTLIESAFPVLEEEMILTEKMLFKEEVSEVEREIEVEITVSKDVVATSVETENEANEETSFGQLAEPEEEVLTNSIKPAKSASKEEISLTEEEFVLETKETNAPFVFTTNYQEDSVQLKQLNAVKEESLVVDQENLVSQVVEKIKVDVRTDTTEMKMLLKPESLGEITLKVTTENGIISAQFIAENEKVRQAIEAQLMELEQSLRDQGLDVSALQVSVGEDKRESMKHFKENKEKNHGKIMRVLHREYGEGIEVEKEKQVGEGMVDYKI